MGLKNRTVWFEPFYGREKLDSLSYLQFIKALCGLFIGLSGTVFCLVILFLGMRWVLNVGGFVASGGPYRIAHQAPDWIWIIPVSIFSAVFFILLHFFNSRKLGGIKILPFLWPALFLSLGYNFFDFAFNPPGSEGGLVVSWLICGILFVLMGGLPLLVVIRAILILIFNRDAHRPQAIGYYYSNRKMKAPDHGRSPAVLNSMSALVIFFTLSGLPTGILLATLLFERLSHS